MPPRPGTLGVGDIYGPGFGPSDYLDTHPGEAMWLDPVLHETDLELPVTPGLGATRGLRVGQFSLAQATLGLLALIGFIYYADRR